MVWGGLPRIEPSTTGGTGHPGLAACKGWRWEKPPSCWNIMLYPRGSTRQRLWERLDMKRNRTPIGWNQKGLNRASLPSHLSRVPKTIWFALLWGISSLDGHLLYINSLNNNILFDLSSYKYELNNFANKNIYLLKS